MLVKGWMNTDVISIGEDTPMMRASLLMTSNNIRCLPVVKDLALVGILTERDLKEAAPSKVTSLYVHELNHLLARLTVKDLMTKAVVSVKPDETVECAAVLMLENKIHALPVVHDHGRLVGIITQTDIFKALINIVGIYTGGIQFALSLEDRPGSIREVTDVIRSHGARIVSILSTRETAEEGCHHVYIRTIPLPEVKLADLLQELEVRFTVLYAIRDLLEEVESRRIRIPG